MLVYEVGSLWLLRIWVWEVDVIVCLVCGLWRSFCSGVLVWFCLGVGFLCLVCGVVSFELFGWMSGLWRGFGSMVRR